MTETLTDRDMTMFEGLVRELIMLREQKASIAKREKDLREAVVPYLEEIGEPTGEMGQHLSYTLDEPIRGVNRVVWQERVTQTVDEDRAEAIARARNVYDDLFIMRPVLNEEAVIVALDDGLISDDDVAAIFPKKSTHALVLEKEKRK